MRACALLRWLGRRAIVSSLQWNALFLRYCGFSSARIEGSVALTFFLLPASIACAQSLDGRWALTPFGCDGEGATRLETPLLVERRAIRWFDSNCTIGTSYKVKQTQYLQGRCNIAGRSDTISIMLEPRGDRLLVGWSREPVQEMSRCRASR